MPRVGRSSAAWPARIYADDTPIREDFQVGQRVSFTDRDLQHRVGLIVHINEHTATIASDGQSWRVSFALLSHIVET